MTAPTTPATVLVPDPTGHPVLDPLVAVCADIYRSGWAENHAGNVSIRLDAGELAEFTLSDLADVVPFAEPFPTLAGESFLVTAAGSAFRLLIRDPAVHAGVITLTDDGAGYRVRWGYVEGSRPTSELPAHLRSHAERSTVEPDTKVVLHCHPTHVVALTHVHPLDEKEITRTVWATNSESILAVPRGVGLLPWMVCGSDLIGDASAAKLRDFSIVVWASHGVLAAGQSLQAVIGTVESVEKAAQTWLLTRGGDRQVITDDQLRELADAFGIDPPENFFA